MVDELTPAELDALLKVLKTNGIANAEVPTTRGTLRVVFEPTFGAELPGETPTPGGWKSPERLDNPDQYNEAP